MTHSYKIHQFHVVWSTKKRLNLIEKSFQKRLYDYMGGVVKGHNGDLLEINGIANHVHLLISLSNLDKYSELIRDVKAGSSLWVRKTLPSVKDFGWQEGYGSFCVNFSSVDSVRKYIQNQEEHHRKHTFEEEFIKFLKIHNVNFDSRFVFD